MNRHIKILVAVLSVILVLLAVAIVAFYLDVSKDSEEIPQDITGTAEYSVIENKSKIIQNEDGMYGLADEDGHIILDTQWRSLEAIGSRCYLAEMQLQTQQLFGIVNGEGDIIVPFVYAGFSEVTNFLYAGKTAADGRYLIYDADFHLLLPDAMDSYALVDETLWLQNADDEYRYGLGASLTMIEADLPRRKRPISFNMHIANQEVLRQMTQQQWSAAADLLLAYLDIYRRQKSEELEKLTDQEHLKALTEATEQAYGWKGETIEDLMVSTVEQDVQGRIQCRMTLNLSREDSEDEPKPTELLVTMGIEENGSLILTKAAFTEQETETFSDL